MLESLLVMGYGLWVMGYGLWMILKTKEGQGSFSQQILSRSFIKSRNIFGNMMVILFIAGIDGYRWFKN